VGQEPDGAKELCRQADDAGRGSEGSAGRGERRIADINTNITNMEAHGDDEDTRARIDVTVEISDLKHLEKGDQIAEGR
jgi:hypothetical protein